MYKYGRGLTEDQILETAKTVLGKKLGDITDDKNDLTDLNNKGNVGLLLEQNVFGIPANCDSNPDFLNAGIELKSTPVKKNKNGTYSAKERLVLNIINYMEEYKNTFYTSSFWNKNKKLLIFFYLWKPEVPKSEYLFLNPLLLNYTKEDLEIIKNDWNIIVDKIKSGHAHEISEADTMYLAACPKGSSKESLRDQPFSNIKAMQRAYSLKSSYMTNIVRTQVMNKTSENILSFEDLKNKSFEESIKLKIKPFIGCKVSDLAKKFNLNAKMKNLNERIFAKMLGIKGKVNETAEFQKANIICKTVRINENNTITECMSFPTFKFTEIINETWENSTLRKMFFENKYLFIVFKFKDKDLIFKDIKLWNMPLSIIENDVKKVWTKTIEIIENGNIVNHIDDNGRRITNFPGMKDNDIIHVRPHGQNKNDTYCLPFADKLTGMRSFTKQCFWIKNKYLEKILK